MVCFELEYGHQEEPTDESLRLLECLPEGLSLARLPSFSGPDEKDSKLPPLLPLRYDAAVLLYDDSSSEAFDSPLSKKLSSELLNVLSDPLLSLVNPR